MRRRTRIGNIISIVYSCTKIVEAMSVSAKYSDKSIVCKISIRVVRQQKIILPDIYVRRLSNV